MHIFEYEKIDVTKVMRPVSISSVHNLFEIINLNSTKHRKHQV